MKYQFSKETELNLVKLGLYQILGGSVGLLIILWNIFITDLLTGVTVFFYLFIILFFSYSIFCGILCINNKRRALKLSLANQILQVINFTILGFSFNYVAGFYLTIGLDLTDAVKFSFDLGISSYTLNINTQSKTVEVNLNLIALAVIYWIDKLMNKVMDDTSIRQLNSIGEA